MVLYLNLNSGFLLAFFTVLHLSVDSVTGLCSDGACTPACRYATKNENAVGHCDPNYRNAAFGNDATCVCGDACLPRVFLSSIMAPNTQLACVGAHHQNLCHSCPQSTTAQTFVPHICLASLAAATRSATPSEPQQPTQSQSQFCMCMCVGPDESQSINSVYSQPSHAQAYSNPYNPYSQYTQNPSPYQSQYNPYSYGGFGNYGSYYGKKK